MANDATQNPTNKWGRHSGAGAGGVTEMVPTTAEAQRGLEPISTARRKGNGRNIALAVTAAITAVVGAAALLRSRRPEPMPRRVMRRMRMR